MDQQEAPFAFRTGTTTIPIDCNRSGSSGVQIDRVVDLPTKPGDQAKELTMASNIHPLPSALSGDDLDQLFLDCADLEKLVASIRQVTDKLAPAVDAGLVTAEHLMNLA